MHKEDSESVPGVSTELRVGWRARSEESGAVGDENIEMGLPCEEPRKRIICKGSSRYKHLRWVQVWWD